MAALFRHLDRAAAVLAVAACLAAPAGAGTGPGTETRTETEAESAAEPFVAGFEDLPLMPGLTQVAGAGMVFDTPGGRIVEAYARGAVSPAEVFAFYGRTLPQLGWRQGARSRYHRDGETLRLEVSGAAEGAAPPVTVHFYLSPD